MTATVVTVRGRAMAECPRPVAGVDGSSSSETGGLWHRRDRLLAVAVVLGLIAAAAAASEVLVPIAAALLLAFLLRPLVRWLEAVHVHRLIGSAGVVLLALALPSVAGLQLVPSAMRWLDLAPEAVRRVEQLATRVSSPLRSVREASDRVDDLASGGFKLTIPVEIDGGSTSDRLVERAGGWLLSAGLSLMLLYFMLAYGERALTRAANGIASASRRRRLVVTLHRLERDFGRYLVTISVINCGLGVAQSLAMLACGMPDPLLWGVLCTVLNFVPYVGSVIGTAIVAMASLVTFGGTYALLPPAIYLGLTVLEGYLITPVVLGFRFHLNPLVLLLAVVCFAWLWGIPGALMAVPILVASNLALAQLRTAAPLVCALSDSRIACQAAGGYRGVGRSAAAHSDDQPITHP